MTALFQGKPLKKSDADISRKSETIQINDKFETNYVSPAVTQCIPELIHFNFL